MTTFTSNEQNQIPIHTDPEQCSGAKLWHALPGRRCLPHGRSPKGLSRMRRTATQTTHTLADIDALIDSAARARLRLALQDAVQCPSPESVAALQEWPREWVLEEEAAYGAVRDQRNRSPIAATAGARPLQPRALGCEPTTAATDLVVGPGFGRGWQKRVEARRTAQTKRRLFMDRANQMPISKMHLRIA
jgi:hypothetical protein